MVGKWLTWTFLSKVFTKTTCVSYLAKVDAKLVSKYSYQIEFCQQILCKKIFLQREHETITIFKYIASKLPYDINVLNVLTLTLPGPSAGVSGSLDSYCSLKPLCSGMGEEVPARTSPTLLPPSPRTVLSLSCFKMSQYINCHDWHCKS